MTIRDVTKRFEKRGVILRRGSRGAASVAVSAADCDSASKRQITHDGADATSRPVPIGKDPGVQRVSLDDGWHRRHRDRAAARRRAPDKVSDIGSRHGDGARRYVAPRGGETSRPRRVKKRPRPTARIDDDDVAVLVRKRPRGVRRSDVHRGEGNLRARARAKMLRFTRPIHRSQTQRRRRVRHQPEHVTLCGFHHCKPHDVSRVSLIL